MVLIIFAMLSAFECITDCRTLSCCSTRTAPSVPSTALASSSEAAVSLRLIESRRRIPIAFSRTLSVARDRHGLAALDDRVEHRLQALVAAGAVFDLEAAHVRLQALEGLHES